MSAPSPDPVARLTLVSCGARRGSLRSIGRRGVGWVAAMAAVCGVGGCALSGPVSYSWRRVSVAGRTACWPVAYGEAAKEQGLMGVKIVRHPMVFPYSSPASPSFWMKDTPAPLTGVWVNRWGRVVGYWHGRPFSERAHQAPVPVSAVVEYPADAPVPPVGSTVRVGAGCAAGAGL